MPSGPVAGCGSRSDPSPGLARCMQVLGCAHHHLSGFAQRAARALDRLNRLSGIGHLTPAVETGVSVEDRGCLVVRMLCAGHLPNELRQRRFELAGIDAIGLGLFDQPRQLVGACLRPWPGCRPAAKASPSHAPALSRDVCRDRGCAPPTAAGRRRRRPVSPGRRRTPPPSARSRAGRWQWPRSSSGHGNWYASYASWFPVLPQSSSPLLSGRGGDVTRL